MNVKLTRSQAIVADKIISELCQKEIIGGDIARSLSDTPDDVVFLCEHLAKEGIIKIKGKTERDPIYSLMSTSQTCIFLENGGFTKIVDEFEREKEKQAEREEKKDKLLDLDLKLKMFEIKIGRKIAVAGLIIVFLSFLISLLTANYTTLENKAPSKLQEVTETNH